MAASESPSGSTPAMRAAALVYVAGLAAHTADHLRRGLDAVTAGVLWAGNVSTVVGLATVVLVLRGDRRAPAVATSVGFGVGIGVAAVHLLPHWGGLSDPFVGAKAVGVSGWSWTVVVLEIAGSVLVGATGLRRLRVHPAKGGRRAGPDRGMFERSAMP